MKKSILVTLLVSAFIFTSCSKDDNNNEPEKQESALIGTWMLKSLSFNGEDEELNDCDLKSNIIFALDGSIVDNDFVMSFEECINDGFSGTYTISQENITFEFVDGTEEVKDIYTFSISDHTLTLSDKDDDAVLTYTKQ